VKPQGCCCHGHPLPEASSANAGVAPKPRTEA
jgi:hypothetical protein